MWQKKQLTIAVATAVITSVIVGGSVWLGQNKNAQPRSSLITDKILSNDNNENWLLYKNEKLGFKIKYPTNIFQKNIFSCTIPVTEKENKIDKKAIAFEHIFPFEWQDEKGDAHKNMTDMAVRLCVVDSNYKDLANYYDNAPSAVTIDNRKGLKIEMGVEGSGAEVYYFKFDENTTLVIGYYYFTAFYDQRLSQEKNYIPIQKQQTLFKQILNSLTFN